MLPETKVLLDQTLARTGKPVHVVMDRDLPVSATIRIARHGAQQHLLHVRPSAASDYFIANQVIFMLRIVELPARDRFDFSPTDAGTYAMVETIRSTLLAKHGDDQDNDLAAQNLAKWALMQVRSIPIGMRVDQQIFRDMPALRTSLQAGIAEQNRSNLEAIQRMQGLIALPEQHLWPATAYALFADRLSGNSLFSVPFEAIGFGEGGRELLRLYDETPNDPSHDRDLVDAWARRLGLSDWFQWIPYQP